MSKSIMDKLIISLTVITVLVLVTGAVMIIPLKTFTEEDNNKTITITRGEIFRIKLQENPTTGYEWNITTSEGLVRLGDKYSPFDRTGRRLGSGGIPGWDIRAISTGDEKIKAVYKRPWENLTGSEETYTLNVRVVEGDPISRIVNNPITYERPRFMPSFFRTAMGQNIA